jgi:HlyD family secretion protein
MNAHLPDTNNAAVEGGATGRLTPKRDVKYGCRQNMKAKNIARVLFLLFILGSVAGGGAYYFRNRKQANPSLTLYGNVDIRQIQLAFHDTGRIQKLLVDEGATVQAGQLVAELDPVRYQAAYARAAGEVAAQREVLARLLAGSRPEEIAAARARVKAADATLRDAGQTHRRAQILAQTQYVSQQKLDDAEATLKASRANLDAEQQGLTLAVKGPRQEDIDAARSQLEAAEAALALAARELADTKLYAPSAGVIQARILELGDMAFPQTPVFTLALTDPVWIRAYAPEPELGRIAPGMRAEVTTDSFPGKVYAGWIGFISPTAEFTPKQVETTELRGKLVYRLRVYVCNPANELRLGMPVSVSVPLHQPRPAAPDNATNPCGGS